MLAAARPIFSETWHRVAHLRLRLQPAMEVQRQYYRGERWYIVRNRFQAEFFRLQPAAYEFLMRLEGRTVEEVWQASLEERPDETPTQDEVIQLLAQLYRANLLLSSLPANTKELFARRETRRRRTLQSRWTNLTSIQLPLWDPTDFLTRGLPLVRPVFSRVGALIWLLVVGEGVKTAVDHWDALWVQTDAVLAPSNLVLLYLALFLIKAIHELGHAFACRAYGGEVHKLGVLLLYFSPVPFVDATSSWAFRSKWARVLVASAGMGAELFVAALAIFLWANTAPGVVHSLAYNTVFVASVTTVLFNANPLLKYDGYYIASDLLELPNLAARSTAYWRYLCERYLFGVPQSSPVRGRRDAVILATFGVASCVYRVLLFSSIIVFLAHKYLLLGAIMAVGCLYAWTVLPLWKLARYLSSAPQLARRRSRVYVVSGGMAAFLLVALGLMPFPRHFRAPGVVEAARWSEVHAGTAGFVKTIVPRSGDRVRAGEPLLVLENQDLELQYEGVTAELRGCEVALDRARGNHPEQIEALSERRRALEKHQAVLRDLLAALTIRAPHDGIWAGLEVEPLRGSWLHHGAPAGRVLAEGGFDFSAVVPQAEAESLFTAGISAAEVRLVGAEEKVFHTGARRILAASREKLPSAALGWRAGGEVAVAANDPHGLRAIEPFYEVRATLAGGAAGELRHGRSGMIRFRLPAQPLLLQWERRLRQLFQKNFQT